MKILPLIITFLVLTSAAGSAAEIIVHADRPGLAISPTLYGAFLEDINRAGDGGLYAELVQNRSFGDNTNLIAWTPLASAQRRPHLLQRPGLRSCRRPGRGPQRLQAQPDQTEELKTVKASASWSSRFSLNSNSDGFPCQPFSIAGVSRKLSLGRKHGFEDKEQGNRCE